MRAGRARPPRGRVGPIDKVAPAMDLSLLLTAVGHIAAAGGEAAEHAAGAAAEHEEHKSELPFFLAGGALSVFAILISVFGFKRPDFPATAAAARGVMTAGAVLFFCAVSSAIYVAI